MPQSPEERRSAPRRADSAVCFRWPGARRSEPVANLSETGAHLLTVRSAPVGSCVEFELLHADGMVAKMMGVVRRVERPPRGEDSDGLLGLSVEFRDLDVESERILQRWQQEAMAVSHADPADANPAPQSVSPEVDGSVSKALAHEGRLWDKGASDGDHEEHELQEEAKDLARDTVERAKETETILELQHRVARAEQLAAEAVERLGRAEEKILELKQVAVKDEPAAEEFEAVEPEPQEFEVRGSEAEAEAEAESAPIMVDALSDSAEVRPPDSLEPDPPAEDASSGGLVGELREARKALGPTESSDSGSTDPEFSKHGSSEPSESEKESGGEEELAGPISGAAKSFRALAAERVAAKARHKEIDLASDLLPANDLSTRAFSLGLLADGKAASSVDSSGRAEGAEGAENEKSESTERPRGGVGDLSSPSAEGSSPDLSAKLGLELDQVEGDDSSEGEEGASAVADQVWPGLELEPTETDSTTDSTTDSAADSTTDSTGETPSRQEASEEAPGQSVSPETPEVPGDAADAGIVFEEIGRASEQAAGTEESVEIAAEAGPERLALDDPDPESAAEMVIEEIQTDGGDSASSWADVEPDEDTSVDVVGGVEDDADTRSRRITYREIPTLEGMLAVMGKGTIARTERFSRLEPVSRVDIQVSDLLLENSELSALEEQTAGVMDRDQLHKTLFIFFQRDLIEVEPRDE